MDSGNAFGRGILPFDMESLEKTRLNLKFNLKKRERVWTLIQTFVSKRSSIGFKNF